MSLKSYIPTMNQTVKIAVAILIIAVVLRVLPIPDLYKSYFRI